MGGVGGGGLAKHRAASRLRNLLAVMAWSGGWNSGGRWSKDANWSWKDNQEDEGATEEWENQQPDSSKRQKKPKRVLEDGSEVDTRHFSKCMTQREKIRAPLLATIKRQEKEMEELVARATTAEKERLEAVLSFTAMTNVCKARRIAV